jgi:hypothetical protein
MCEEVAHKCEDVSHVKDIHMRIYCTLIVKMLHTM